MDHVVGSCCCFIQSTFDTEVWHNVKAASWWSSGERLEAWIFAQDIGFGGAAHDNADIVIILQGLLENSKTAEASSSRKNKSFRRHGGRRPGCKAKYKFRDRKKKLEEERT